VDFGQCTPTMDFQLGRAGRKATEGTFLPTDPLVAKGQQDALNPNIITNRICDQLVNVCDANDAAVAKCQAAKAQVATLTTKDQTTADAFNSALGF
jgi:phage I-like protein